MVLEFHIIKCRYIFLVPYQSHTNYTWFSEKKRLSDTRCDLHDYVPHLVSTFHRMLLFTLLFTENWQLTKPGLYLLKIVNTIIITTCYWNTITTSWFLFHFVKFEENENVSTINWEPLPIKWKSCKDYFICHNFGHHWNDLLPSINITW